jgi:general secretion pathway protein C
MGRIGIWVLNGALFVLCCFLTANLVNGWIGEWVAGPPAVAPPPRRAEARAARSWNEREVILKRNLFQVSTLLPAEPTPEEAASEEQLEATRLPLRLLGTVASSHPGSTWAAVENTQDHSKSVVRVNDMLLDKATVLRIERRRIVLQNGAKREELALDESQQAAGIPGLRAAVDPSSGDLRERIQRLSEDQFRVQREEVDKAVRNPAELFSQARILPKYENGQMMGVQLNSIQPGSLFEQIGIKNGDTVTQVNGIVVTSPQDSAALLKELTAANQFQVNVVGADGQTRTLSYSIQQ